MIRRLVNLVGPRHAAPLRRTVLLLALSAALQGGSLALVLPILRGWVGGTPVWPWLIALAVVVALYAAVTSLGVHVARTAGYTLSRVLHDRIGGHVVILPLGWFDRARVGSLGRLVTQGVMDVMGAVGHLLEPLVTAVVGSAAVVVVLLVVDWRLGLAAALAAPLMVLAYRWTGRLVARTDHAGHAAAAEAGERVVEFAQQQPVLRAFGRTAAGLRVLDDALTEQHRVMRLMLRTAMPGIAGFALTVQTVFTLLLAVVAALAVGAHLDGPTVAVLLLLAVRFTEPAATAAELGAAMRMASGSVDRVAALLATPALPAPAQPARAPGPDPPDVELDGVVLTADTGSGTVRVLQGVSVQIPAGTVTAVVGPSGAGKTALLRVIARFVDVDHGAVRIGGVDVRDLAVEDLMARIAVVFQDVYLFEGTLEENVRLGRPDADREQIRAATRLARVDEIAARLPQGWATRVGEGGSTLSGGERQRVSIARALLKGAPVVLLDEATSALDAENEAAVVTAVAELSRRATVIVVAHRLETVRHANQIVVVDAGRIIDAGTHSELLTRQGRYADFWNRRARARGWRIRAGGAPV